MMRRSLQLVVFLMLAVSMMFAAGCRKKPVTAYTPPAGVSEAPVADDDSIGRPISDADSGPFSSEGYLQKVYFDFDRSNIRPDQLANIEHNVRWMLENPGMKVLIEGHCDERGTVEYNFALGLRRAESVRDFMVSRGVKAENLSVISKGEEEPAVVGHTEEAYAKNRRAEFLFLSRPPAR